MKPTVAIFACLGLLTACAEPPASTSVPGARSVPVPDITAKPVAGGGTVTSRPAAPTAADQAAVAATTRGVALPPLKTARAGAGATLIAGAFYVVGGASKDGPLTTAEVTAPKSGGGFQPFSEAFGFTGGQPRAFYGALTMLDTFFMIGGTGLLTVAAAPVTMDNSLGQPALSKIGLTRARENQGIAFAGGFVYVVGGRSGTETLGDVERAKLADDGSLGAFTVVPGATLGVPRTGVRCIALGKFLYAVGGQDAGGRVLASIERAPINQDGSLGAFTSFASLPVPRASFALVPRTGAIYLVGGISDGGYQGSIERAPVQTGDVPGAFVRTAMGLDAARSDFAWAAEGPVVYMAGGNPGSQPLASAEMLTLPD
ncbi:MAG: hypothetical protein JWM80_5348 [Cyanobacteria bacterium RYN_339]|nr:hypothetical protein [Cyanobacteria bacterium RYN_339]